MPKPGSRKVTAPTVWGHLSSTSPGKRRLVFVSMCRSASQRGAAAASVLDSRLYSSLLRRPAAVVRQRRDILDARDLQPGVLQLQNRLLPSRARSLDLYLNLKHAVLAGLLGTRLGGPAGREWRAFSRPFETDCAGRCPCQRLAVGIGDGHHRVVEGRLDVGNALGDALADALLHA